MNRVGAETDWANRWAPYDEATYTQALAYVPRGATVLDIGAGDLRLARRVAGWARLVYAIEQQPHLLAGEEYPPNLIAICADARTLPFPAADTAILLMRHCRDFALYRRKLEHAGCARLITNARWGLDVECIDLLSAPRPYENLPLGWYACRCGATGFRDGPPELLSAQLADTIFEVGNCPECIDYGRISYRLA